MRFGRSRSCSRPLSLPAVKPSLEEFRALAEKGNVVPVYAQLAADFETPLSAYLKIRDGQHAFLLESAESTEFSPTIQVPADAVEAGRTYRVRVRMQDDTGRWSHWSLPIEFEPT